MLHPYCTVNISHRADPSLLPFLDTLGLSTGGCSGLAGVPPAWGGPSNVSIEQQLFSNEWFLSSFSSPSLSYWANLWDAGFANL